MNLPDPILASAVAFDSSARRFGYRLNEHFGQPRGGMFSPFQVRIDVRVSLGASELRQQMALDSARKNRPTADELLRRYTRRFPNPAGALLQLTDPVGLSDSQRDSLRIIQQHYQSEMAMLWRPVASEVAGSFDRPAHAVEVVRHAESQSQPIYEHAADAVRAVLTTDQYQRLPESERLLLNPRLLELMGIGRTQ
jgi:hypothetical protein